MLTATLSLAAFAAATEARVRWRAARIVRRWPREGETYRIGGVSMHTVIRGQGPDVVLIHGASGSLRDFTFSLLPKLAERYRVLAMDRPGLGYSDPLPGPSTLSDQARIIRQVASVCGMAQPIVVGHSYGGAVALAWAVDTPNTLAGVVTLAGVSHLWPGDLPLSYRLTSGPLGRLTVVPLAAAWIPYGYVRKAVEAVFEPDAIPAGYLAHFGPAHALRRGPLAENARQRRILKSEIASLSRRYGEIRVPVEILHGTADTTVDLALHAGQLARDIPGANLTVLPGLGHMPHHAAEPEIIAAIDRIAQRLQLH